MRAFIPVTLVLHLAFVSWRAESSSSVREVVLEIQKRIETVGIIFALEILGARHQVLI